MQTKIVKITKENKDDLIQEAEYLFKKGEVVVFPTETVYGLGANALDSSALKKIFEVKGRPSDNPLIVHIGSQEMLKDLVLNISESQKRLMNIFWPGPFTLIFKKKENIPSIVSGGLDTIAVRMPEHYFALEMLQKINIPIAAPSANISGKPSSTDAQTAFADLSGKVPLIIDDGISNIGLESTVVKEIDESILILRPGAITQEMIQEIVDKPVLLAVKREDLDSSPGTKYRHYAPNAKLQIVFGKSHDMASRVRELALENINQGKKIGVLGTSENMLFYQDFNPNVFSLGSGEDLLDVSKNIYQGLRFFDNLEVDLILAESFEEKGVGLAIMDRLKKASLV